ncbi:MAG: alkyl sulfatase dimerization domain-containing protein [Rhodocyclaceae bacterium]|nr:alkyl sulfatase dimerization domain-containing protein [Rhodocyclaceae bacterium]
MASLRIVLAGTLACAVAACGTAPTPSAGSGAAAPVAAAGAASAATLRHQAAVAATYDLQPGAEAEDARRGFIAAPTGQIRAADGRVVWDFDAFAFEKGAAPPTVNPSLWRQALLNNSVGLFKVTEGIWQVRGFDLANLTLIEGRTGWIVVDTLTTRETAAAAMAFARQHLGARPVSAVVFTHSHVDHFGGALGVISAEEAKARQVPVVAPAGFMEEATSENLLVGTAMGRRAAYMYGNLLPRNAQGAIDTGLGKAVALGRIGILAPTVLVDKPTQALVLDGVRFVFHNAPGSEAPAEMVFSIPEKKAFGAAELVSHTLHNLYTLRGAKVRDALAWAGYIDDAIGQLDGAEVVFGQHHWPVWGHGRIVKYLESQRDAYRYMHDQTVRGINAGLTAPEIAETMRLPRSLDAQLSLHGYYGTVKHNVRAIYQYYMGWFDANPANLDPLPPVEGARKYVQLAGGADAAVRVAQQAYDQGDYRWSAELLKHVVLADGNHRAARELQAKAFEQLGYQAESAPWRNFYLSGALELRNGPPTRGLTRNALVDMLQHTPTERFLDAMAGGLNGPRAEDVTLRINLRLSDTNESHGLWIDNAVLHHRRGALEGPVDATLTMTKPFFLRLMIGEAGAMELLSSDQTKIDGSMLALRRFFGLIDRAPGNFPIVTR